MLGIGPQELIIIGVLFLLVFGSSKFSDTVRDIGRFTNEARRNVDEFKTELTSVTEEVSETRRAVVDEFKSELDLDSGQDKGRRQASHAEEQIDDAGGERD